MFVQGTYLPAAVRRQEVNPHLLWTTSNTDSCKKLSTLATRGVEDAHEFTAVSINTLSRMRNGPNQNT